MTWHNDYIFHNTPEEGWINAQRTCEQSGGNLASIHSSFEMYYLMSQLNSENYLIGFHDLIAEGTYEWVDGTPFDYELWTGSEPNNGNG